MNAEEARKLGHEYCVPERLLYNIFSAIEMSAKEGNVICYFTYNRNYLQDDVKIIMEKLKILGYTIGINRTGNEKYNHLVISW